MQKLEIKVLGKNVVRWQELVDIQGEVKTIDDLSLSKMINSLKQNGFCDPFVYWDDPVNKRKVLVAGNQRLKAIKKIIEDNQSADENNKWNIPDKLPAVPIKAENEKEAKKILLSLASTFGQVQEKELRDFIEVSDLDYIKVSEVINFIEIKETDNPTEEIKESPAKASHDFETLRLTYMTNDFLEIQAKLELLKNQIDNPEVLTDSDVVKYLIFQATNETNKD